MQQPSIFMQLLQAMDNLVVVTILVAITIGVRQWWVAGQKKKAVRPQKDYTLETINTVLIALVLVFGIVRPFLLQTFFIPSGSMEPTLLIHDRLIANKFVFRFRTPEPGEVVVFQPPVQAVVGNNPTLSLRAYLETQTPAQLQKTDPDLAKLRDQLLAAIPPMRAQRDDYIKRVIGAPGDRIRIVAGEGVYVNGKLLPERYLPGHKSASAINFPVAPAAEPMPVMTDYLSPAMPQMEAATRQNEFYTALGYAALKWYSHEMMYEKLIAPHVINGEYVVPKDAVFVMGDNRSDGGSFDSRYWGAVPLKDVKARAISTFFPLTRLKLL